MPSVPQDPHILIPRHHPLVEGSFIEISISHTLHQDQPSFHNEQLAQLLVLNPHFYIWIIVCYVFALCSIWLVLLLRVSFRLNCTFLSWPGCWASPYQHSHLGSGQTMTTTTDASCYCHCDDYSSGGELQCQLMIVELLPQLAEFGSPSQLFHVMTLSPSWAY